MVQPAVIAAALMSATCFGGFGLLHALVEHGHTKAFDRRWLKAQRTAGGNPRIGKGWVPVMLTLTQLGGPLLRYLIALPITAWLYERGQHAAAWWICAALGTGWIADTVAKKVFKRHRPTLVPHLARAGGPSFPSGHTFNGLLVYSALSLGFAPLLGPWLLAALAGCALLSLAIAFSRVWLGVHWPTDVGAGWLLGAAWLFGSLAAKWQFVAA